MGIGIFFIIIGICIKFFKMYFLIAGYNTMSAKEKEKYNIEKIANLFLGVMVLMGSINIAGFFIEKYTSLWKDYDISRSALILSVVVVMPLLFFANSKKFRK